MAGRPQLQTLEALIAQRGGEDWLFDQLAERSVGKVARDLGYSRQMLYDWRDASEQRAQRWKRCKDIRSDVALDEGDEIMENLASIENPTPAQVQQANSVANWKRELAKMLNPAEYSDKQQSITLNIGSLHLDALRAASQRAIEPVREAEFRVLEAGVDSEA
jgi:hypothetical protein